MKRTIEAELLRWKAEKEPIPLLLRGARQVGKSFLVQEFGEKNFDDVAIVDFEQRPELKEAFASKDPKNIIMQLEFFLKKEIKPGKCLLFLDEIQQCPQALMALRYFKEQLPFQHVIAAGSLLEFLLNEQNFNFPVGRIEFLYLRPFSFNEYLLAAAPFLDSYLDKFTLDSLPTTSQHTEYLKWVRRFLFVGGMPAAIKESLNDDSLFSTNRVHSRLLQAYESDFGKYAKHSQHRYLQRIFQKAPSLIAQILKYTKLDEESRARELKPALDLLYHTGLLKPCFATSASGLPLEAHIKHERFKLYYLDVGLLQSATKTDPNLLLKDDILQINDGMIAEQFVAQELVAYADPFMNASLLYWEKNKGGQAEVDFVISCESLIIPIEVKAGSTGSLRSLKSFSLEKKTKIGVRISEHPLSLHDGVLSIPFYLIKHLPKLIRQACQI